MTLAISAHGTRVYVQLTAGGSWTEIAEMGDVQPPGLSRNEFDASTQDKNIDAWVLGVLRRSPMTMPLNFLPANNTHDHLTGLQKLMIDNTVTGFKIVFSDTGLTTWVASGQVQNFQPKAPVDGKLSADVTIRFSGVMMIGGVTVGS